MLRKSKHVTFGRRVAGVYLAFCSGALAVALFGVVVGRVWSSNTSREARCLGTLERASSQVKMDLRRNNGEGIQEIVENAAREPGISYCFLISNEREFIAHSNGTKQRKFAEPIGKHFSSAERIGVRYTDANGTNIREFRTDLNATVPCEFRIAMEEATLRSEWNTFGGLVPLILSLSIVGLGVLVVTRDVGPLSKIEQQLASVAAANGAELSELRPIAMRAAVALGWNQLVDRCNTKSTPDQIASQLHSLLDSRNSDVSAIAIDHLEDGVIVTDCRGEVTLINRNAKSLLGIPPRTEISGRSVRTLFQDPKFELALASANDKAFVVEITRGERDVRVSRSHRMTKAPLMGGCTWTLRDVTQHNLKEKMHAQFVDAATHELRTPLANIKAYAETLALTNDIDIDQQKEFSNTISVEATRLARFIDDLLDVRSLEAGSLGIAVQTVDLERLFADVIGKVSPLMTSKNIAFQHKWPDKLPEVSLDKDKMFAVLVNLLGNAAKYTPDHGSVDLDVQIQDGVLRIAVTDTGFGITDEELPNVFDRFFRSNDSRVRNEVGTGLGLSLAKEVVELHGGTMSVTSELNEGSTFSVQIPIGRSDQHDAPTSQTKEAATV
ncbi:MAG: PAS domain-containing protein [Planctomycetales bacterium]|nr:PAS domain-containing protein [Planctomycetales bacterium]